MALWAAIGCEPCGCAHEDEWPDLPQRPAALRAWVAEHGCPECGSLTAAVEYVEGDDAS